MIPGILKSFSTEIAGAQRAKKQGRANDPGEFLVTMEWETADDWIKWMNHQEAKDLQWQVDSLIGEKTFFEVYKPEDF